jgi:hypothetical protein
MSDAMARIHVGNTDNDWFDFLSSFSGIDDVNFWNPSPGNFKAISEGERFAFRLKSLILALTTQDILTLGSHSRTRDRTSYPRR